MLLRISYPHRPIIVRVMTAFPCFVLGKTTLEVSCYAGIEGFVFAFEDINVVGHGDIIQQISTSSFDSSLRSSLRTSLDLVRLAYLNNVKRDEVVSDPERT